MIYDVKKKGFTLIETLVAVSIFAVISMLLVNIFRASVNNQNRILENQQIMNESDYSLGYMSKAITMAQVDDIAGDCTGTTGHDNFGIGTNSITFLAHDSITNNYKCRRFILDTNANAVEEQWSTDTTSANLQTEIPVTSSKVKIDKLTFVVTGDVTNSQPKVTILISMEYNNSSSTSNPKINIQTSVSQRNLNITQ